MGWESSTLGGNKCSKHFVWIPQMMGPLWRRRYRWEDNIKMDLRVRECEDVNLLQLAQDRIRLQACVNVAMSFRVS